MRRKQNKKLRELLEDEYINRHGERISFTEISSGTILLDGYYRKMYRRGPDFIDFSGGPMIYLGQSLGDFFDGETRVVTKIITDEDGVKLQVSPNQQLRSE